MTTKRQSKQVRWTEAVEVLRELQGEYQDWLDNIPENLQSGATYEKLEAVCDLDLDEIADIELPQGFGRD